MLSLRFGENMATAQFNIRMPEEIQRQVRVYAASTGVKQRDVVMLALERFFEQSPLPVGEFHVTDAMLDRALAEVGPQIRELMRTAIERLTGPEPLTGQLTVDEAHAGGRASRRPRAAEQAERSKRRAPANGAAADPKGTGRSRASGAGVEPGGEAAPEPPAGCPECGADVDHGKCVDCGWLA